MIHECLSCSTDECVKDPDGETDCYYTGDTDQNSPKIFLTFYGTDKWGDRLLSESMRLGWFNKYSITSLYQSAIADIRG